LAVCVAVFQGAIQTLSRSYYAKNIPKEKASEYFGLFDIFGKGAIFMVLLPWVLQPRFSVTQKLVLHLLVLCILLVLFYFKRLLNYRKIVPYHKQVLSPFFLRESLFHDTIQFQIKSFKFYIKCRIGSASAIFL